MSNDRASRPRVPPRWFVRIAWLVHRGIYRITFGKVGLWSPKPDKWGTMRLTVAGRRTGRKRSVILGYIEDGPNLVTIAMNGWGEGHPDWWLNLQTNPDGVVDLVSEHRLVRGRKAHDAEAERIWSRWREIEANVDAHVSGRSTETAVVVLEPR